MARPTKAGLEYFPLDVDIFEDEKVIPVSSEFGAKGECIIIRVLCAIYRNGYFAECSDSFKFKIAKQANLPNSLVSEVIAGLVKWGFFDKPVFDSFNVITSTGIQKRWKEATRKRVAKNELDYWILELPTQKQGFLAEETPLNRSESTQSKVKESKEKEKREREEKSPPENPIFERVKQNFLIPISECKAKFLADEIHCYRLKKNLNITQEELKYWLDQFFTQMENKGENEKSMMDTKSHFGTWLPIKLEKQNGKQQEKSNVYEY